MRLYHAVGTLLLFQLAAGVSSAAAQKGRKSDVITAEEIAKSSANNAHDVIKTLRPAWLRPRGITSGQPDSPGSGGIQVYLDGVRMGGPDELDNVPAERVQELRYVNANDATTKYGTGHTQGAIEVTTKR
jgi:hypothetical protein